MISAHELSFVVSRYVVDVPVLGPIEMTAPRPFVAAVWGVNPEAVVSRVPTTMTNSPLCAVASVAVGGVNPLATADV